MKKWLLLTILSCMSLVIAGCGTNKDPQPSQGEQQPSMNLEGYVVEKTSGKALVVNPDSKEGTSNPGPVYFSTIPDTVQIGDKVSISFYILLESYPGQAEALDVKVLPSQTPEGADLSEAQALKKALSQVTIKTPILTKLQYNKEQDKWTIEFTETMGESEELIIEDK